MAEIESVGVTGTVNLPKKGEIERGSIREGFEDGGFD
jgi:hypothetical protein